MKIEEMLKPKVIAEILSVSVSAIYAKLKRQQGNRFSDEDIAKIKEKIKSAIN